MRLHKTLVEKLVRIYATYGGYRDETRLRSELEALDLMPYARQDGLEILVDAEEYKKEADSIKHAKR